MTLIQLLLDRRVGAIVGRRSTEQRRPLWSIFLSKQAEQQSNWRVAEFCLLSMLGSEQGFCSSLPKFCLVALFRSWRDTTRGWISVWQTDLWEDKSSVLLTQPKCCMEFLGNKVVLPQLLLLKQVMQMLMFLTGEVSSIKTVLKKSLLWDELCYLRLLWK